jgi:hypothetical protein
VRISEEMGDGGTTNFASNSKPSNDANDANSSPLTCLALNRTIVQYSNTSIGQMCNSAIVPARWHAEAQFDNS